MSGLLLAGGPASATSYEFDKTHSGAGFKVRHYFTMVPGSFTDFTGKLEYDEAAPEKSSVEVTIQAASIETGDDKRDAHLRTADFFDAEKCPTISFKSTRIEPADQKNRYKLTGDLTIRCVTRPVVLDVEFFGFGPDGWGGTRGGFHATGKINRKDFGIVWNKTLDTGGVMLGDEVLIDFPVEVVKKAAS